MSYFSDVNECANQNGGCSHKCTNKKGSYVCSCPDPELNLAPDRHTCVGKKLKKKREFILTKTNNISSWDWLIEKFFLDLYF